MYARLQAGEDPAALRIPQYSAKEIGNHLNISRKAFLTDPNHRIIAGTFNAAAASWPPADPPTRKRAGGSEATHSLDEDSPYCIRPNMLRAFKRRALDKDYQHVVPDTFLSSRLDNPTTPLMRPGQGVIITPPSGHPLHHGDHDIYGMIQSVKDGDHLDVSILLTRRQVVDLIDPGAKELVEAVEAIMPLFSDAACTNMTVLVPRDWISLRPLLVVSAQSHNSMMANGAHSFRSLVTLLRKVAFIDSSTPPAASPRGVEALFGAGLRSSRSLLAARRLCCFTALTGSGT